MTSGMHSDIQFIQCALMERKKAINSLIAEMKLFEPIPLSEMMNERNQMKETITKLNPHKSDEEIESLMIDLFDKGQEAHFQFSRRYSARFMSEYVTITIIAHTLCEAIINTILSIGLAENGIENVFDLIERTEIKEKWAYGPLLLEPSFRMKDNHSYGVLTRLCKERNAIVHNKPKVYHEKNTLLKGNMLPRLSFQERTKRIIQYIELPYGLHRIVCSQITNMHLKAILASIIADDSFCN